MACLSKIYRSKAAAQRECDQLNHDEGRDGWSYKVRPVNRVYVIDVINPQIAWERGRQAALMKSLGFKAY